MAAQENLLFHVDTIVVDGLALPFEDGSAMLSGAARFENEVVPSASGIDFAKRKRVPTIVKLKLQFGNAVDPAILASASGVQIMLRDGQSQRRVMLPKCMFASLGDLGGGSVDLSYIVLSPPQWL